MEILRAPTPPNVTVIGAGRLGTALAAAFAAAGIAVDGPHGRGFDAQALTAAGQPSVLPVLLCVPDRSIGEVAQSIPPRDGLLVGHCSGATTLEVLRQHEAFSLHPLMTVPASGADFTGATAAVAGSTDRASQVAEALAAAVGMVPVQVRDADRLAYHAAAAVASNQLLAVLDLADQLAASFGLGRARLAPLVQATVRNWEREGAASALTGPVVRGDEAVLAGHRRVIATRCHTNLALYDELIAATRRLAATRTESTS